MKRLLAVIVAALAVSGCSSAGSPPGSAGSTAGQVNSAEAAVARVVAENRALTGIGPEDPELIGGCCFWRAEETDSGFEVVFEVGWGDCPAGCIDRHRWTYAVGRDGSVELLREEGPTVPPDVLPR